MDKKNKETDWRSFFRLLRETDPPKIILSIALALSITTTLAGLVIPLFTKNLVDSFSKGAISQTIILILVAAFILQAAANAFSIYLLAKTGQMVVASLREKLWRKFLTLKIPYFDEHLTGEMVSRLTNDTSVIKDLISYHFINFITGIISAIGAIAVLFYLDWKMTLIILISVPVMFLVIFPIGRKMNKISRGMQDETASFTSTITQVLSEIRLVKSSNAERKEIKNGKKGIDNLFQYGLKEGRVQALVSPLVSFIMMALLVVIIGYGGMRVASGTLSSGDLVAFLLYLFQIVMPMAQITVFFTQLQKAKGATERIGVVLRNEEEDYTTGMADVRMNNTITLDKVNFQYSSGDTVLNGISFSIAPGKITAIVGPSGGGKTTIFGLLERYYEPDGGTILLGENSIYDYSLKEWRSQIGYVAQESPLIAGTIRDNICYGIDREISDEEINMAAKMAYADQFIEEFPKKFDTEVGERGIKLSGGQRQRIGIARALLRDPSLLMLDEATSSLDSQSELFVQKALQNLMKGRTTLVIAHRLSTVIDAHQIVFIEKGRVTGTGTHQELFETHAMYRVFATQQLHMKEN